MTPPLRIHLGPSRRLALALVVAHLLPVIGIAASGMVWVAAVALVPTAVNLVFHLRRHAWLTDAHAVTEIALSDELDCELAERSGSTVIGSVLDTTFVAPWLVVINARVERRRFARTIVVMPDAADGRTFRELRVWLRWRRPSHRVPTVEP